MDLIRSRRRTVINDRPGRLRDPRPAMQRCGGPVPGDGRKVGRVGRSPWPAPGTPRTGDAGCLAGGTSRAAHTGAPVGPFNRRPADR